MIDAYSPEEVVEMIMLKKEPEKCLSQLSLDMDDEDMSTKIEALSLNSQHARARLEYILVKIQ